jgi:hypothetical protein
MSIEIYCQLIVVYEEGVMNESNMRKWSRIFNKGRTNIHDEEQSRRLSLITEDLKNRIDQHIRTNSRFTLDENCEKFPQPSRSLIHEIATDHLHYEEICAKWVPQMPTAEHKSKHMVLL